MKVPSALRPVESMNAEGVNCWTSLASETSAQRLWLVFQATRYQLKMGIDGFCSWQDSRMSDGQSISLLVGRTLAQSGSYSNHDPLRQRTRDGSVETGSDSFGKPAAGCCVAGWRCTPVRLGADNKLNRQRDGRTDGRLSDSDQDQDQDRGTV